MDIQEWFSVRQSRRSVLRQLGMVAALGLTLDACGGSQPPPAIKGSPDVIEHVVIACQENRTFDEYFGHYSKAGKFGLPAGYSQPDGKGGKTMPFNYKLGDTKDIGHSWQNIHKEWNNGAMDGFVTTDGRDAVGYYTGKNLPYYYALADAFTLCGNYFCYQLGATLPNRIAIWAGTSGGITIPTRIPSGSLDFPTIVDLLEAKKVTWKCYNLGSGEGSNPAIEFFNALPFFKRWYKDPRLFFKEKDYYNDLNASTLPQVTFLISDAFASEHPPTDIYSGERKMAKVINALIASQLWPKSAFFLTYDEGGGYFDHVPPPKLDAYGLGFRVPMLVISPWVKRGYISGQLYEHNSMLKFIERRFGLPTLASVNHQFDVRTPGKNNAAANGQPFGPPAPPRDGLSQLGDFYEVFDFSQNSNYYPKLPSV